MQNIAQILGRLSLLLLVCMSLLIATPVKAKHHAEHSDYEDRAAKHRIAGGYPISENDHPSFVSLYAEKWLGFSSTFCSGVAISGYLVLTAAHCFVDYDDDAILAAPGIWAPHMWSSKGVKSYKVSRSCRSRRYNSTSDEYDFQVLRLEKPVEGIRPAFLPAKAMGNGYRALTVGIGMTSMRPKQRADRAQALPVEKVDCPEQLDSIACFQSHGPEWIGSSCPGDSGGPLYAKTKAGDDIVTAISSFIYDDCQEGIQATVATVDIFAVITELTELADKCSKNCSKNECLRE